MALPPLFSGLAFREAFFQDFFVGEPQIGDIGGAETENVFQGAAHFTEMEVHADTFEQFDERLRTHRFERSRADAVVIQPMIGHYINGLGTDAMAINMKEPSGFGPGRCETCGYT